MKIRSAVLREMVAEGPFADSKPLVISELELAPPGPGEVLVKMVAAGLCHSDLSVITGVRPRPLPMALGHEASAEVIELGAGVDNLRVGQKVALVFVPSCGHCSTCMEGRPALCEPGNGANGKGELLQGGQRLSQAGASVNHHCGVSAFSDHAVVSARSCIPIGDDIDPVEAAVFGCAVLTGVGAVVNTGQVRPGASALIVGLGGVGLSALLGALAAGANPVVAVDVHDSKLELALALGASHAVNARDADAVAKIRELTRGGVDYAFEFAGSVPAMQLAYAATRRGGTTVTAGLPHPNDNWPLQQLSLTAEERTIKGSYIGSCIPGRDIPRYVGLYRAGKLPVNKLIGEKLRLDDINAGFDRLASGSGLRDLIVF
ncbi:zinc-dependent alcohol dehydrogenase family protein [Pseudomonas sp. PDM11]|uniref:zinc-dependent alcohol dehydrogenase family protein n=1 Tax=Pseudomonas sp. PDM11 TaxID=2769309 RepID=UPI00177F678F|nr:zinc-dependent alcohol dehydrogenase family protein [Pseudomonas sp. PDM11]MBD9399621.1 zinc-dependent alcohol dehydrogenase family protein [Pseudomonas sp. PDM11]